MLPSQLREAHFKGYSPNARKLAAGRIALLQELPLGFTPFLLKEVIAYDWKFPAEQRELEQQLSYLASLAPENRKKQMAVFAQLRLAQRLEDFDWVNSPGQFLEQLSSHLWSTHQMDAFRAASEEYMAQFRQASPPQAPSIPRLGIVLMGRGVDQNRYPLFRKLRRQGVYFSGVKSANGLQIILDHVQARAAGHPAPFAHWHIDGGTLPDAACPGVTCVSYQSLTPARFALHQKMRSAYESPHFGAEALRSLLARMSPQDLGLGGSDPVLDHFQVSLLTEGSGTQVFSTTFVQWTAREALRRAQPVTLFARFTPRQQDQPMNELLAEAQRTPVLDPMGSLIDADMGAYYTWLNLQRLAGAEHSAFLALFEDHSEAVAVGPSLPRGAEEKQPIELEALLRRVA